MGKSMESQEFPFRKLIPFLRLALTVHLSLYALSLSRLR